MNSFSRSPMTSFVDQTEHRNSTQSLSRAGSEVGSSNYQMESGLYVSSFVATIFIAALVTVGVLFITLLTTLTVMLQSCQNRKAGVVELPGTIDEYGYCKTFALHAELNKFEANDLPTICRPYAIQYIKGGHYLRELKFTLSVAKSYFRSLAPQDDGLDVVLMDIDDILTPNRSYSTIPLQYSLDLYAGADELLEAKLQAGVLILELYSNLQTSGWSLILMTRKPEKQQNATIKSLISSGYGGWSSLIMRSDDEMQLESWDYFSRRRVQLQKLGFRISSTISSQMDVLTGSCLGKHMFKLPNPLSYEQLQRKCSRLTSAWTLHFLLLLMPVLLPWLQDRGRGSLIRGRLM